MKLKLSIVSIIVLCFILAGCSGSDNDSSNSNETSGNTTNEENANEGNEGNIGSGEDISLSYWVVLPVGAARSLQSLNDMMIYQELEKSSGIHIEFEHPSSGSEAEQFNLMIASGDFPDLIETNFTTYPGGPEKAIADNVIIPLNDLIAEHAPNYRAYLDENPEILKQVVTDNGTHYVMPAVGVGTKTVSNGLVLRKDWLDELSLEVPETIEEWTHVLREFKEKKGAEAPLTMIIGDFNAEVFNGPFGIGVKFYLNEGTVKFGPYEEDYLSYLELMKQWYDEGLLDPDFAIQDGASRDAKILNGQAGAFKAYIGSGIGKYLNAAKEMGGSFDLVAAPYPVMNKGEEPRFINRVFEYRGDGAVAITRDNENPVESIKWLDHFFSNEGNMLKTFGVEGLTYEDDNGYPRYTDLIVNNPDGLSVSEGMSKYLRASTPAVGYVGDDRYNEQYYVFDQQKHAAQVYGKHELNTKEVQLPPVSPTPEEANEMATIMAEVNTYHSESLLQFIMGNRSLEEFGEYKEQLKNMGIERAIEIQQSALDRYNQRN